ncbi:hypothetical protein [Aquibium sp. ELW1220]|uniref:hypothetical protein n=1 Tax=Aquibium sp. ELW1220 TaxID=2976766 RepID=UPI0025B10A3F|nr:hypothetical protein [Aquibium sp. ELW1220]MDN2584055.1 hypothetical protein [Aquibium sp. ELW1220]
MNRTADLSLENFRRLPGLYRRWELTEVCEPNRNYQIEDAGTHADGTPLLAIYVSDRLTEIAGSEEIGPDRNPIDPRTIIPAGLVPSELVSSLPLIIEVERPGNDGPSLLSLFGPNGATLADLYLAVMDQRDVLAGSRRTERALTILLDRLLGHGAGADTYVSETIKEIANVADRESRP